jgi:hypothetical protein
VVAETALAHALHPRGEWYDARALQTRSSHLAQTTAEDGARWSIDLLDDYRRFSSDDYVSQSRQLLVPLRWVEERLEVAEGYGAPEPKRQERMLEEPERPFFDLVGVRWYVRRGEAPFPDLVERSRIEGFPTLYESATAFPRAWVVHTSTVMEDRLAAHALREGTVDLRHTVILSQASQTAAQPCPAGAESLARVVHRALHEVRVEVDTCAPGHLVLSDAWDPGWRATVDGRKSPVFRANYLLRAVEVPEGRHTVVFRYEPDSFRYGSALSLLGLFAFGGLMVAGRKRADRG